MQCNAMHTFNFSVVFVTGLVIILLDLLVYLMSHVIIINRINLQSPGTSLKRVCTGQPDTCIVERVNRSWTA